MSRLSTTNIISANNTINLNNNSNSSNNSSNSSSPVNVHRHHLVDNSTNLAIIDVVAEQTLPPAVFQPLSSPVIEATDEEEHDLGVYGLGHHNKSLPLSDSSPVNDDSGTGGGNSNHSGSRIEGGLNSEAANSQNLSEPGTLLTPTRTNAGFVNSGVGQAVNGPYYVIGQSSDSNLYSLDDDGALFDENSDDEEIFMNQAEVEAMNQGSPSSSQRTVIQQYSGETSPHLKKQASQASSAKKSSTSSSRRCQCVECQLLEHPNDNLYNVDDDSTNALLSKKQHRNQSNGRRRSGSNSSKTSSKKHQPPTTLSIDSSGTGRSVNHHHTPQHKVYLHRHNQVSPTASIQKPDQQDGQPSQTVVRQPSLISATTTDTLTHSAITNHGTPPIFYAIRDGVIFQPGLPPSLSVESLRNAPSSQMTSTTASSRRRLDQLFGGDTTAPSNKPRHHHRHHRSKHLKSKQHAQQSAAMSAPLRTKHRHNRHHHQHFRHTKLPQVPTSSPTVASRHFGVDTGGYPSTSSSRRELVTASDNAVLNFSSFRVIIERIKRWFLIKSRKILTPRNFFGRGGTSGLRGSASSLSSLAASSSSLSGASTSSTTSLCDSNPSLSDLGIVVPPLAGKGGLLVPPATLGNTAATTNAVTITIGGRPAHGSSSSSLASSESTNSLLELKKRVVRQRRENAEKEQQLQAQQHQQDESQKQKQRQYLQVHGKNAFTVTSTISCPTGRAPANRRTGGLKRHLRNNPETSTLSTNDLDHSSLQLSASWPLVDRLSAKFLQQQADAMLAPVTGGNFGANQMSGDGDASAFYNENGGDTGGHTHTHATMAERRAGWRHYLTQTQDSARDSVCSDCAIPFQDLEFGECVRDSEGHKIFSGRWYGTVMIHLFSGFSDRDVGAFWSEVHKMVTLRHDNVALFMGAAVERSALAIVISVQTHISLFDQIHINGNSMAGNVLTIGRQLAQGMVMINRTTSSGTVNR